MKILTTKLPWEKKNEKEEKFQINDLSFHLKERRKGMLTPK